MIVGQVWLGLGQKRKVLLPRSGSSDTWRTHDVTYSPTVVTGEGGWPGKIDSDQ